MDLWVLSAKIFNNKFLKKIAILLDRWLTLPCLFDLDWTLLPLANLRISYCLRDKSIFLFFNKSEKVNASSIAKHEPCAKKGNIGWAASPISMIFLLIKVFVAFLSNNPHLLTFSDLLNSSFISLFQLLNSVSNWSFFPSRIQDSSSQVFCCFIATKFILFPLEIG